MSKSGRLENLRWGLWWGGRYAVVGVVLSGISVVIQGKLDALLTVTGLGVWLLGIPLACLVGGAVVGILRPLAVGSGVFGAAATGMVVWLVLGILVNAVAYAFGATLIAGRYFVWLIFVGGLLGAFAGLFLPMLMGEPVRPWGPSSSEPEEDPSGR